MKKIVLKCDDFFGLDNNEKQKRFARLVSFFKIKVNWGVIGFEFKKFDEQQLKKIKSALASGYYSFFNHGYFHNMDEFMLLCETDQIEHIKETNRIVKDRLGITLQAFGVPFNHLNEHSLAALNKCKEIKYWLFGNERFDRFNIPRILEIEYPLFKPNFIKFYKNFKKLRSNVYFCVQIHPNSWDSKGFLNFILIILFLKLSRTAFIFTEELEKLVPLPAGDKTGDIR